MCVTLKLGVLSCLSQAPYPRGAGGERRAFGRPDDDYIRNFDYESPRFYPNGGPRNYHNEDKKVYHSDSHYSFSNESRGGPANRRVRAQK